MKNENLKSALSSANVFIEASCKFDQILILFYSLIIILLFYQEYSIYKFNCINYC